jgi:hypothetical protein
MNTLVRHMLVSLDERSGPNHIGMENDREPGAGCHGCLPTVVLVVLWTTKFNAPARLVPNLKCDAVGRAQDEAVDL